MLIFVHAAVILTLVTALLWPAFRKPAAAGLGGGALGSFALFLMGSETTRSLDVDTEFAAFVGNKISYKGYLIETVEAPAHEWFLPLGAFFLVWAALIWVLRPREGQPAPTPHPFWVPMMLAWSGCATVLWLQKTAAPDGIVSSYPWDRILFPATLAAAWLLAVRCKSVLLGLSWLSLFVTLTRLPLVMFGTWATNEEFGTSLDVHGIEHFANPFVSAPVIVEPGSYEQLGWLLWAPHLLIFPAIYMFSAGGLLVMKIMFEKAGAAPH